MLYLKGNALRGMLGGNLPFPCTFLRNKNVGAFVVENKEDITVAEKMQ